MSEILPEENIKLGTIPLRIPGQSEDDNLTDYDEGLLDEELGVGGVDLDIYEKGPKLRRNMSDEVFTGNRRLQPEKGRKLPGGLMR